MNTSNFLKRLRQELPTWEERGWLTKENSQAVLQHVEQDRAGMGSFLHILAILGAILAGMGLVTYVAANWQEMGKAMKLLIPMGALYASYGAGAQIARAGGAAKLTGTCFLLGVIAFGAAIMLIAQNYHISAHNPSGALLLWVLGGLLTAYLLRSQPAMVLTTGLSVVWGGTAMYGPPLPQHQFEYLLIWLCFLPAIHLWHWRAAAHAALVSLMAWSIIVWSVCAGPWWKGDAAFYLVQVYFFLYFSLVFAGMLLHTYPRLAEYASLVRNYGLIGMLLNLHSLSSPHFQTSGLQYGPPSLRMPASEPWIYATVIAFLVWCVLGAWLWMRTNDWKRPRRPYIGQWLAGAMAAMILTNLGLSGADGAWVALLFNLLLFGGLVWLTSVGLRGQDRFLLYTAFSFIALGLFNRYFDYFWTMHDRALFFTTIGLLLFTGAWFLRSQHRRILPRLKPNASPEPAQGQG